MGFYLNPPDHALVLSVDEKSQVQVFERTQPCPPSSGWGTVQGITHDYYCHGTTTLFAALTWLRGPCSISANPVIATKNSQVPPLPRYPAAA